MEKSTGKGAALGKWRALEAQHPHHTYYGTNSKKNLEERDVRRRGRRAGKSPVVGVVSNKKRDARWRGRERGQSTAG